MFEYFNYGIFFFVVGVMIINIFALKEKFLSEFFALYVIVFIAMLLNAYFTYRDVQNNIAYFKDGNTLICSSGCGREPRTNLYSVSKSEGWRISNHYFIKDSLMLTVESCEEQ